MQVAQIAPQVAGQITELHAQDNQYVHKGDLLYVIDKIDYKIALDMAKADVSSKKADLEVKQQSERAAPGADDTLDLDRGEAEIRRRL